MKKLLAALTALAAALSLTACGGQAPASSVPEQTPPAPAPAVSAAVSFTDDLGREVTLPQAPRRVAAMIGSFADVWCLAGGRDTLAAAANDAWTSFDLGLGEDVADLGAVKEPSLEALLAAEPDFILASANTAADMDLLETFDQAGIPAACFDVQHFDDYLRMLDICTRLTGDRESYRKNGLEVQARVEAAVARADGSAPTVICMRATGSSCKVKGSEGFLLGEMLADLGCRNLADGDGALLEDLSIEEIILKEPDYIFAVLQGADPSGARATLEAALLSNPAWGTLRAVREGRFHTLEHALYNLKPNARWGEAYEKLADILYPAG